MRALMPLRATAILLCLLCACACATTQAQTSLPISGHVTFLYYENVAEAAVFYAETLGLENTLDEEWVKFFSITPSSWVALVDGTRGYHRVSDDKPVMLSIVTEDVDAWYARLQALGVTMLKPLNKDANVGLVDAFLVRDPGGYTVEVFQWRNSKPSNLAR